MYVLHKYPQVTHYPHSNQNIPSKKSLQTSDWNKQPSPSKPSPTNSPPQSKKMVYNLTHHLFYSPAKKKAHKDESMLESGVESNFYPAVWRYSCQTAGN
jgi:hypothetical protein